MSIILSIAKGATIGILMAPITWFVRYRLLSKTEFQRQQDKKRKLAKAVSQFSKYVTILALLVGLVWTVYFLILGIVMPDQAGYATNISQLIVSVITVISIIFAYIQFLRDKS